MFAKKVLLLSLTAFALVGCQRKSSKKSSKTSYTEVSEVEFYNAVEEAHQFDPQDTRAERTLTYSFSGKKEVHESVYIRKSLGGEWEHYSGDDEEYFHTYCGNTADEVYLDVEEHGYYLFDGGFRMTGKSEWINGGYEVEMLFDEYAYLYEWTGISTDSLNQKLTTNLKIIYS